MIGFEVVVGFLVAWAVRKAGRVGQRLDAMSDEAIDAGLDRLHDLVGTKLGGDAALAKLETEVGDTGEATTRTQARVRLALEDAAEEDPAFATALAAAVTELEAAGAGRGGASAKDHGVAIGGDVRADNAGIAIGGVTGGQVSFGERPDPPRPARS